MTQITDRPATQPPARVRTSLDYLHGFGNEHHSEAVPGALIWGQNSPQRAPMGLYAEQISGTAFTEPRGINRRTWMYRIMPTAAHGAYRRIDDRHLATAPIAGDADPNRLRWNPLPPETSTGDFLDGLYTIGANGDVLARTGIGVHQYTAARSMTDRYLADNDGELLIVPETGGIRVRTELGVIEARPGEIVLISRAIKFAVDVLDGPIRGYVCENYGAPFVLPDLGPIGANGLAHARDFRHPVAAFEEGTRSVELVVKFGGHLWATELDHSPLDVVAWHGNHGCHVYDLESFSSITNANVDHPDPSVFTVLTSPSGHPGQANVDFVAFPPRWMVAERTFRPPHFHRNVMTEFMGLIYGVHDSKAEGFLPGGASLHNMFAAHGPDLATFEMGTNADLEPQYLANTMAIMFETRFPLVTTPTAMSAAHRQPDYDAVWSGLTPHFDPQATGTTVATETDPRTR